MLTVGILYPAVGCRIHIKYVSDGSRMGLIYFIRGLSALFFLYDLRQCEGLGHVRLSK